MHRISGCGWLLLVAILTLRAGAADPPAKGLNDYISGLDALENAQWNDSIAALGKAIEADEENPDYHLARGVAYIFSEQLKDAATDLLRADKLRESKHKPTRMWMAVGRCHVRPARGGHELLPRRHE